MSQEQDLPRDLSNGEAPPTPGPHKVPQQEAPPLSEGGNQIRCSVVKSAELREPNQNCVIVQLWPGCDFQLQGHGNAW